MSYVTLSMLCAHARKSRSAVCRAIKAASVKTEKPPGARGLRITLKDANAFLSKHWPEVGQIQPQK